MDHSGVMPKPFLPRLRCDALRVCCAVVLAVFDVSGSEPSQIGASQPQFVMGTHAFLRWIASHRSAAPPKSSFTNLITWDFTIHGPPTENLPEIMLIGRSSLQRMNCSRRHLLHRPKLDRTRHSEAIGATALLLDIGHLVVHAAQWQSTA